ncbi:MAG TPA: sulfatase-like hydrolase/transferase [Gemmatimonadales bacterium]|jgi:membrane-anchored protein YejM (alkaline phosphatase superfamily)
MTPRTYRLLYGLLLAGLIGVVILALVGSRTFAGHYARPPLYRTFRVLFYLQQGLFVAVLVAAAGPLSARLRSRILRTAVFLVATACVVWLGIWGVVHARFGIRLSLDYLWELFTTSGGSTAVGLAPREFAGAVGVILLGTTLLAMAGERLARRSGPEFCRRVTLVLLLGFLPLHLAVRADFTYQIGRNQRAILALDDASPLPLRSEYLIPGLRHGRRSLPNLSDEERTARYLAWAARPANAPVPRPVNILWIVIESFRFDAISAETTPYLFAHREEFQLRLDRNHWSGGNATRAGVFSMFAGVAAYHANAFRKAGLHFPLLNLLAHAGYRIRIGKSSYFKFGDLQPFLPPEAILAQHDVLPLAQGDRAMVDAFLRDDAERGVAAPALDVLSFEASHWPYEYPPQHRRFEPAAQRMGISDYLLPEDEVRRVRNRYRNSCHFIDSEIARVLERLRRGGALDHTIVLITGDHGEEFRERGQLAHAGGMNDFQGRVPLWIHFPGRVVLPRSGDRLTTSLDIVPTLLDFLGFREDILRTQGTSLLEPTAPRPLVILAEQGIYFPQHHALISDTYISRWRHGEKQFLFAGVERRDGGPVVGDAWWSEVQAGRARASLGYELLPDIRAPAASFQWPRLEPPDP